MDRKPSGETVPNHGQIIFSLLGGKVIELLEFFKRNHYVHQRVKSVVILLAKIKKN